MRKAAEHNNTALSLMLKPESEAAMGDYRQPSPKPTRPLQRPAVTAAMQKKQYRDISRKTLEHKNAAL